MNRKFNSNWAELTAPVLVNIFYYLSPREIVYAGATCKQWNRVSFDNFLWRYKFCKEHCIDDSRELNIDTYWYEEFKRLFYHTPLVVTEIIKEHSTSVLHVSFSNDGKSFVTCSKDALVVVWSSSYPVCIKHMQDMKHFLWTAACYSEFNESNTLLLVCGSHLNYFSGEIAVFSLEDEMRLICCILSEPHDAFGTFYSDSCIFSSQSQHLENFSYLTSIWLNKVPHDVTFVNKPIEKIIFRFLSVNAGFVRFLLVARCNDNFSGDRDTNTNLSPPGNNDDSRSKARIEMQKPSDRPSSFLYQNNYKSECSSSTFPSSNGSNFDEKEDLSIQNDKDAYWKTKKYLIFTTGSNMNVPHQIGIKRIGKMKVSTELDPKPWLAKHVVQSFGNFDSIDHLIEMHGRIVGLRLSPDHRFLYVNCRPWLEGYVITNPLDRPPTSPEIDIHVINMDTFKEVGGMFRAHKDYTVNNECCSIFLDVSHDYIASGSEDKHGYLWDRRYGTALTKLPHDDIVNCVAFNPKDQEMLVTVSQDSCIKVWRSRARTRDLNKFNGTTLKF